MLRTISALPPFAVPAKPRDGRTHNLRDEIDLEFYHFDGAAFPCVRGRSLAVMHSMSPERSLKTLFRVVLKLFFQVSRLPVA